MTLPLLILLVLLPWAVTLLRVRKFRSVPVAASAAFIASGGILLCLALLGAGGTLQALEQLRPDGLMMMVYVGIGMMIAAVACALIDRR
ncbi:hypothetical protein AB0F17_58395 [Nonomuraea sp. NPDC026600]|uniref:hypothetical protein n=1 Tax=Nonomuraea sp. NPDC026600 TaxID=3155363 RepID=UPI0033EDAA49